MILRISRPRDLVDLRIWTPPDLDPSGSGPLRIWTPPDLDPSGSGPRGLGPLNLEVDRVITPKLVIL